MKEYIAKDDVLMAYIDAEVMSKADICREFVKEVDERFIKSFQGTSITYSECAKLVLAEMEQEVKNGSRIINR